MRSFAPQVMFGSLFVGKEWAGACWFITTPLMVFYPIGWTYWKWKQYRKRKNAQGR